MGRREGDRLTLLSERTSDGERAVLLFDDPRDAEMLRVSEGLGEEWEVVQDPPYPAADRHRGDAPSRAVGTEACHTGELPATGTPVRGTGKAAVSRQSDSPYGSRGLVLSLFW